MLYEAKHMQVRIMSKLAPLSSIFFFICRNLHTFCSGFILWLETSGSFFTYLWSNLVHSPLCSQDPYLHHHNRQSLEISIGYKQPPPSLMKRTCLSLQFIITSTVESTSSLTHYVGWRRTRTVPWLLCKMEKKH